MKLTSLIAAILATSLATVSLAGPSVARHPGNGQVAQAKTVTATATPSVSKNTKKVRAHTVAVTAAKTQKAQAKHRTTRLALKVRKAPAISANKNPTKANQTSSTARRQKAQARKLAIKRHPARKNSAPVSHERH